MQAETRELQQSSPGTRRSISCLRYGGCAGPVVYLQAGLHADEMPGVLVLQHLLPLLDAAEAAGHITGEIRVVPMANPLGLSQWAFQRPLGRLEAETLHNFNRGFPDLAALAGDRLKERLTGNSQTNVGVIREAFREVLRIELASTRSEMREMQLTLLKWSCDADIVLDLHCDHFAVLHLYTSPARPDVTSLLCRSVGAKLALLESVSGGNAFDEAHTAPWLHLSERFGSDFPIPSPCFATTLEYRGQFDVDDETAMADAENLMTFLACLGVVTDRNGAPKYPDAMMLPLAGAAEIFAPLGGVVTWAVQVGASVREGETIAYVTDPIKRIRFPVHSPTDGMLFRQELWRPCLKGASLAHVAGAKILRGGNLLSD